MMSSVPSPCNDVCIVDRARTLCTGCFRTLDEIAAWAGMDDAERREVWRRLERRRAAAAADPAVPEQP